MKKLLVLVLALMLVLSMAACNTGSDDEPAAPDTGTPATSTTPGTSTTPAPATQEVNMRPLVVGSADFTGDFHSGWGNASYDVNIRTLVFTHGLLTNNQAGELIESPLVRELTVSEDLLTWKFYLNDGITFHNGEALTASDVKFTYDFYMDIDALRETGGNSSLHQFVENVTANDAENSVTFELQRVIFTTDASVFFDVFILPEDTITQGAAAAGQTVQQYVRDNISRPIGYGAYMLEEYRESEFVRLKVFPDFVGHTPAIQEIIVVHTPNETELDQLLQGEIDMLFQMVEDEKIDAAIADPNIDVNSYFRHGGGTIVLHTDFGPTSLTEVRQAFTYVLNRPLIIDLFLGQYGLASQGPYSKNQWMMYDDDEMHLLGTEANSRFEDSLIDYDILDANGRFDEAANIAMAQDLLDRAVARTDGEYARLTGDRNSGYLWDGQPMEIRVTFTDFWSDVYHLAFPRNYVDRFGFNVSLHGLDWPVMYGHWIGESQEARQYHAFVGGMGYALKVNPRESYSVDRIMPWGQPSSNGPRFTGGSSMTPDEWEQLLTDMENAHPLTGANEFRDLFRRYVEVMNYEQPIVAVYSNNYFDAFSADLENLETNALWGWAKAVLYANWR